MTTTRPQATDPAELDQPDDPAAASPRRFVVLDFDVVRSYGLSPFAGWLYAALKTYADYETGRAWPKKDTLAGHLQKAQGRSIDPYIAELREAGLITSVHHRYCNPADKRDWVIDQPDEVHTAQTSNLYVVNMRPASPQVTQGCAPTHRGSAPQRTGGVRPNAHELKPSNKNHPTTSPKTSEEKTSVGAAAPPVNLVDKSIERKHRNGERTPAPMPLHPDWTPNNANRAIAAEVGVNVEYAVELFREEMSSTNARRRGWGATFTKFLKEMARYRPSPFGISEEHLAAKAADHVLKTLRTVQDNPPMTSFREDQSGPLVEEHQLTGDQQKQVTDAPSALIMELPYEARRLMWVMAALEKNGLEGASVRDRAADLLGSGINWTKVAGIIETEIGSEGDRSASALILTA